MAITENQLLLGGAVGGGCFLISTVLTLMVLVHRERVRMNKTESSGRGRVVIRADSTGSTNIQSVIRPTDGTLDHQEESFPQRNSTHRFSTRSNTRSAYTSRSFRSRSLDGYTADGAYNEPLMYPLHVGHDVPFPDHTRHQQTVRSNLSHPHVEGSPAVVPFRESNLPGQGHVHYSSEGRLTSSTSRGKDEDVKYMDSQSEVDSVYSSRRSIPVNIGTSYHRNMDDPPSYRDNPPSYTSEELSTSLAHNPHPAHNPHQSNVRSRYGRILHSTSSSQGQGSSSHSGKYQKNQTSRSDRRPSNDVTNMDDRRSTNASRRGDRRPSDVKSTSMHDIRQPSEHASSRRQNSYEGSSAVPGIALPSYYETADHYSDVSSDVEHIDVWHSEDDGYF